jgi:hypothetical protein
MSVFNLTVLPEGRRPISSRLVLTVKSKAGGSYDRHKARLVVRGFLAKLGVDYFTSFSPMAMLTTTRVLITIGVKHNLPIAHADIKNAFVDAKLKNKVAINLPPGITIKVYIVKLVQDEHPDVSLGVVLDKALYGLPNSPGLWNGELDTTLKSRSYRRLKSDSCLYIKENGKLWTLINVSVDDLLITGTDKEEIKEIKDILHKKYGLGTWDDQISSFLGMNCSLNETQGEFHFDVRSIIEVLLSETELYRQLKPIDAPWSEIFNRPEQMKDLDAKGNVMKFTELQEYLRKEFRHVVGCLIYCSFTCRSDITTLCNICCKSMAKPTRQSVIFLEVLLRYLKKHPGRGLTYYYRDSSPTDKLCKMLAKRYK